MLVFETLVVTPQQLALLLLSNSFTEKSRLHHQPVISNSSSKSQSASHSGFRERRNNVDSLRASSLTHATCTVQYSIPSFIYIPHCQHSQPVSTRHDQERSSFHSYEARCTVLYCAVIVANVDLTVTTTSPNPDLSSCVLFFCASCYCCPWRLLR